MKKIEIFIGKNPIEKYAIVAKNDGWRAKNTAVYLLNTYVDKLTDVFLKREENDREYMIKLEEITEGVNDEYMRIRSDGNNVLISGGRRGIIYAVCEFLEKYVGVKRYAIDEEVLPTQNVVIPTDIDFEKDGFKIENREVSGSCIEDGEFKFWLRLNSRRTDSAYGGAVDFVAGREGHTLSGGYLLNKTEYKEKHPEWFALVNGKRLMGGEGQVCLTSEGALQATIYEVKDRIRSDPRARYVSVSIDDNYNYCRCENCMKALETQSMSDLHFTFINRVAKEVKKAYPNTLIHTFAYAYVVEPPSFALEDNVAVQYCTMKLCHAHAIDDPSCPHNKIVADEIRDWAKKCKYLMIWDYNDNHLFNLIHQPSIVYYRRNLRFYAENNMQAFFNEDDHVRGDGCPTFSEMKTYLFSKLCQDPYMSEEEYRAHMLEFANAYYGAGGKYIVEYLYYWAEQAKSGHLRFTNATFEKDVPMAAPVGASSEEVHRTIDENVLNRTVPTVPMEKLQETLAKANELFDKAEALAENEKFLDRIKRARVHLLFYELFFTMDDVLENGAEEEVRIVKEKNRKLVKDILKYRFKRTLFRGTYIEQMSEMISLCDLSPKHWGYGWWRDANK